MALDFFSPVNLNEIPLLKAVLENLSSPPAGVLGKVYFNTGDNIPYIYTASGWIPLIVPGLQKKTFQIGNGSATSFLLTHNLNSLDLIVTVRTTASPYEVVLVNTAFTNTNQITVTATQPVLATNELTVTVVG